MLNTGTYSTILFSTLVSLCLKSAYAKKETNPTPVMPTAEQEASSLTKKRKNKEKTTLSSTENVSSAAASGIFPSLIEEDAGDIEAIKDSIFRKLPTGKPDSLFEAMASTYETNPEIREKRAALRGTNETIVQARAGWRPTISGRLEGGLGRTKNSGDTVDFYKRTGTSATPQNSKSTTQTAGLSVEQNLFKSGQTVYQTREAQANILAARYELLRVEQDVLFKAAETYLDLLTKYVELELLRRNEESLKKTLEVTKAKFEVGEETRTGVAQAEGQYAQAAARRINAEAEVEASKALFERVTNRKPGHLAQPLIPTFIPKTLEEVLEKVRLNNPAIKAAQFQERAARHKIEIVRADMLPEVNLIGNSRANLNRTKTRYAGNSSSYPKVPLSDKQVNHEIKLELRVPIYEKGLTRSKTRQAAEQAEERRIHIESIRREILEKATKYWNDFVQAKEGVKYYKIQVKARVASLEGVRQEYAVGSKILVDVLNEMARLVQAQLELVQNQRLMYLAAYQVLLYMGDLNAKALKLQVNYYDPAAHYHEVKYKF